MFATLLARRRRRATAIGVLFSSVAVVLGGCGDGDSLPPGDPLVVLRRAPALTEQAGRARVVIDFPDARLTGAVDFEAGVAELSKRSPLTPGKTIPLQFRPHADRTPENPFTGLRLVRQAHRIDPAGGRQVRGVPALEFDLRVIESGHEIAIRAWVDRFGRLRRVELPSDLSPGAPATTPRGLAAKATIDFVAFD